MLLTTNESKDVHHPWKFVEMPLLKGSEKSKWLLWYKIDKNFEFFAWKIEKVLPYI